MKLFNEKKYEKEITELRRFAQEAEFPSARQAELRASLLRRLETSTKPGIVQSAPAVSIGVFRRYRFFFASLAGLFLVAGSTVAMSANTVPGDALYPVKIAKENAQMDLTFSETAKVQLSTDFAQERLSELNKIESAGKTGTAFQQQAQTAVAGAVQTLLKTRDQLQEKNSGQSVAAVSQTIDRLVQKFSSEGQTNTLTGTIQKSGGAFQLVTGSQTLTLVGKIDFDPFVGQQVELTGSVGPTAMSVASLRLGSIEVAVPNGEARIKITQPSLSGQGQNAQAQAEGLTFSLGGQAASDAETPPAQIEGILRGQRIIVTGPPAQTPSHGEGNGHGEDGNGESNHQSESRGHD